MIALPKGTANFTKVVLAAGTTTTLSTTTAATFAIDGKMYVQSAAWTNQATPTTDATTGEAFVAIPRQYGAAFVVGVNAALAMKVSQGPLVYVGPGTVANTAFTEAPSFPGLPADFCPIGYIILRVGSDLVASTWTFGSSNLATLTGCTRTFQDVHILPSRPQTS